MKKNMTKVLLLAMMLMASSSMLAQNFRVDGLRYVKKSANEVWVVKYEDYSRIKYEGEFVVPDEVVYEGTTYKVTGVDEWAFGDCQKLTSVTLGNNVKTLSKNSFAKSKSLAKVVLGKSIVKIEDFSFYECEALTSIELPESLTEMGESVFCSTGITSI